MKITYIPDTRGCFPGLRERLEANTAKFIAAREGTTDEAVSDIIIWSDPTDHIAMVRKMIDATLLVGGGFVHLDGQTGTVHAAWQSHSIATSGLQEYPADANVADRLLQEIAQAVRRACSETPDDASPA